MTKHILLKREGPLATIVLNRPEKLNALTKSMWQKLAETFVSLSRDDDLRCIIIRGAGGRAFSPGNDIKEFEKERNNVEAARAYGTVMCETLRAIESCKHPVIAMIQGVCVGGGLEIASVCDLRICAESSRFGIPVNRLGLVMSLRELRGLANLVGRAAALEILLEGEIFGAARAREMGLVNRVVADDLLEQEVEKTAARIVKGAPLVARWHKQFINRLADPTPLSEQEMDEGYACFGTEDFQIGYRAFLEKTEPKFKGR
ncbi:MAG: enoyl-CoA hydratase/isomerase family protein [bacterium]